MEVSVVLNQEMFDLSNRQLLPEYRKERRFRGIQFQIVPARFGQNASVKTKAIVTLDNPSRTDRFSKRVGFAQRSGLESGKWNGKPFGIESGVQDAKRWRP
jgi:hypothetical protein